MDNELEAIYKSGFRFLEPLTLEETYQIIVKESIKLVEAQYGSLTLLQGDEFTQVYSTLPVEVRRRKKGFTFQAFKKRKILIINTNQTPGFFKIYPDYRKLGIESIVLIPLFYKKEAIGVLAMNFLRSEKFKKRELDMLQIFASLATLAIRKNQLYQEARKALEIRDLFISMAAHELRTPLTSVNGYIQLLKNRMQNKDTQEARWVESLYNESIRLTNLANELLEINRIRAGKLNYVLKECSLRELSKRMEIDLKYAYPNRQFIFEDQIGEKSDVVIGDYDKILQALYNLVENAIKFSAESSPVKIKLKNKNGNILVQVIDQGAGIDKKDLDMIFKGFYQGNHQKEGLGLGLFLVNNIISRLHGNIKINSKVNRGTTVEVALPELKI